MDNGVLTDHGGTGRSVIWKQDAGQRKLPNIGKECTNDTIIWKTFFAHLVTARHCYKIRPNGGNGWRNTFFVVNIRVLEPIGKPKHWLLFPQVQLLDQSFKFFLWEFLTKMDWKLRFHQSADPRGTSYVVISKETERFVNETHNHNAEVRSSMELLENLQESKRSEPYEERKVTTRSKETSADPSMKETRAGSLSLFPNNASLSTRKIIPTNEKKSISLHAQSGRGSDLAVSISKTVTTMLRHFDQDERESDGSRHWESIKSVLVRKFAHEVARDFSDTTWLQKTFEARTKKKLSTAKIKLEFSVVHELFKDTLVVFQASQKWWVMFQFFEIGKRTYFTEDVHGTSNLFWELDWFQEERGER